MASKNDIFSDDALFGDLSAFRPPTVVARPASITHNSPAVAGQAPPRPNFSRAAEPEDGAPNLINFDVPPLASNVDHTDRSSVAAATRPAAFDGTRDKPPQKPLPSIAPSHSQPHSDENHCSNCSALRSELYSLRDEHTPRTEESRHLRQQTNSLSGTDGVETTIREMQAGIPLNRSQFRGMSRKMQLLQASISMGDPQILLEVVIFLKETLSAELFHKALDTVPSVAWSVYTAYLRERGEDNDLLILCRGLGRKKEEALVLLKSAFREPNVERRVVALRSYLPLFQSIEGMEVEASLIQDQIHLYERQFPVEKHDTEVSRSAKDPFFEKYPRTSPLLGRSVLQTLEYCLFYHVDAPSDKLSSPVGIKNQFKISDKKYAWSKLRTRAWLGDWPNVMSMVEKKRGLLKSKHTVPIGFGPMTEECFKFRCPPELLAKLAACIEEPELKYQVASKCRLPEQAIEALVALKSKTRLTIYREKIVDDFGAEASAPFRSMIDNIIAGKGKKWK